MLDDECYVGVRDVKTHELITILPIGYHKVWKVSEDAEYLAMELSMQSSA